MSKKPYDVSGSFTVQSDVRQQGSLGDLANDWYHEISDLALPSSRSLNIFGF